jgi:hypothetical protein
MQQGAELLIGSVSLLMSRIRDLLEQCRRDKAEARARAEALAAQSAARPAGDALASELADRQVYLIAHDDDDALAQPLRDELFQAGFTVWDKLQDPTATPDQNLEAHKQQMTDCDAVLVCHGRSGEFWLRSQLSDLQKALAWRSGRPLLARALYLGPPDTAGKGRLRVQGLRLLDGRQGYSEGLLAPLVQDLFASDRSAA